MIDEGAGAEETDLMAGTGKKRLDEILVGRGLLDTRAQARGYILAGKVRSGSVILDKPGKAYPEDVLLEVERPPPYVSRGGEKLAAFLDRFDLPIKGIHVLDVGASTGGFTDCLLQRGAAHATCVDVGRGQLHNKLVQDPRVTSLERTNARALETAKLPFQSYEIAVMDVSFISLRLVLLPVWTRVAAGGALIALIKPQFEAGKAEADEGRGVIRDPAIHRRVIEEIRTFASRELPGAQEIGLVDSPIKGADGNREFLIGWKKIAEAVESGLAPPLS